jgi:hypothetical protein
VYNNDQYWVQAAPFRALAARLLDLTGLPWPALAEQAGVPPAVIHRLLFGREGRPSRRIPRDCAQRLLDFDDARVRHPVRRRYP